MLTSSIQRGLDFLTQRQLASGEFLTLQSPNIGIAKGRPFGSPFITTFVLYCLKEMESEVLLPLRIKALNFLLSNQEKGGLWRNHNKITSNRDIKQLPPDLDDMSTVSHILSIYDVPFDNNYDFFTQNLNDNNLYLTWIKPDFENEVDCVVNTNVLLYLGGGPEEVFDYINETILHDLSYSLWYPDKLVFYYMVSRAVNNGLEELGKHVDIMRSWVLKQQNVDGGFGGDMQTALAINILMNFGHYDLSVKSGIDYLLENQRSDGSWGIAPFFRGWNMFYGSVELSTALALEALHKYKTHARPVINSLSTISIS